MKLAMDELAQTLFEEAGDGLFFFEPQDGHLIDVNPMGQRLTGYPRHELLRLSVKGLFSAEVAGGMARLFRAFQSTGLFHSQEGFLMRGAQGRTIPVNLTVTRVHARQGTLGLITARDITERRQAEEALRRSERHYRNLFENAHDAILLLDPINERVLDANRQACELYGFGRQELIGLPLDRICPDEAGTGAVAPDADVTKTPSQTVCHRFETVHRRKDGSEILLEVNSSVIRFGNKHAVLTINRDVSERKHLEEQLRQAQKMEALGRLAGGVAHDFNNLLTVVTGYSDCLVSELPPGARCHVMAEEIRTAALRAAELTGQLLAFGRKAIVAPKVLDLNAAVRQTAGMLRRLIGEHIELVIAPGDTDVNVRIDPGQLNQVILNLAVNARDAMPQGGRLTIATAHSILNEEIVRTKPNLRPGPHAVLTFADTGCGMSPEALSHIFEPFFTTKEVGKGTGLGLATVYAIIEQAQGHIEVDTHPGQGATFQLFLPHCEDAAPAAETEERSDPRGGTETVLLVEDQEDVRNYTRLVLEQEGYRVLQARDGAEGLQLCRTHTGPLHLLLTDVVLPKLGGRELAAQMRQLRPGLRVLFISGYTDDSVLRHGVTDSELEFLSKPYRPNELADKVRQVLDKRCIASGAK